MSSRQAGGPVDGWTSLNVIWLLHAALEGPVSIFGLFLTRYIEWTEALTAATIVVIKMWSVLALSVSVVSLLLYGLPDGLPGKRAGAILLILYHGGASSVLLNAPPFTGALVGGYRPEAVFGVAHGVLALLTTFWWQVTVPKVHGRPKSN